MLVVPWSAGVFVAGFRWPHLILLAAWITGYLLSYYVMQAVKTRRPRRFRAQLLAYGPATAVLGGLVLALQPRLLWFAIVFVPLLLVNTAYAWRHRERAVVNDFASVTQSSAMLLVAAAVGGMPVSQVWLPVLVVSGYFAGTVLYVKTMIRERGSVGYRRASVLCHSVLFVLAVWLHPLVGAFFGLALSRAWLLPGTDLRPKQVGIVEIVLSVLLVFVIVAVW